MKIAIITDGNNTLGLGHIYQSMTLANFLSKKTHNKAIIYFITKSGKKIVNLLKETNYPVFYYSNDNLIFNALRNENPDRIIFDKLDVSPVFAKKIKEELSARLIIFTNLTAANQYADVNVLADIGSDFKNIYQSDKVSHQTKFFGPRYWLLRPEFYKFIGKKKKKSVFIENIMIIFGGADKSNFSTLILNELLNSDDKFFIKLVLGAVFKNNQEIINLINSKHHSKSSVQVLSNVKNVADIMSNSDLVFASPGLSFFEALAVGTPVICYHQNNLQRDTYKGFFRTYGKADVKKTSSLIISKTFIYPDEPFIKNLNIGEGKDDILYEILK